jgi:hypothetical protein
MKSRTINPDLLPILTDTVDGTPIDMPTLTQSPDKQLSSTAALTLSEQQCKQLAKRLFPDIEAAFLNAINSTPEASWETAMQQVRTVLPKLIRKAAQESL